MTTPAIQSEDILSCQHPFTLSEESIEFSVDILSNDHTRVLIERNAPDGIYGFYETTDADYPVDFFICDEVNYEEWNNGDFSAVRYQYQEGMAIDSWAMILPYSSQWHFVFINDNVVTVDVVDMIDIYPPNIMYLSVRDGETYYSPVWVNFSILETGFALNIWAICHGIEPIDGNIYGPLSSYSRAHSSSELYLSPDMGLGAWFDLSIYALDTIGNDDWYNFSIYLIEEETSSDTSPTTSSIGSSYSSDFPIEIILLFTLLGVACISIGLRITRGIEHRYLRRRRHTRTERDTNVELNHPFQTPRSQALNR